MLFESPGVWNARAGAGGGRPPPGRTPASRYGIESVPSVIRMRGTRFVPLRLCARSPRAGTNVLVVDTVVGAPASTLKVKTARPWRPCCVVTVGLLETLAQMIWPGVPPLAVASWRPEPGTFATDAYCKRGVFV